MKNQNIADIDRYTEELNKIMGEIYSAMSGQAGGPNPGAGPQPGGPQGNPQSGNDAPDEQ